MGSASFTKNQTLVLNCLNNSEAALTAYDILDAVRADGIRAPVQVYRALEHLIEAGAVHRIESMNAYVACSYKHDHDTQPHKDSVAFAICDDCGVVSEIPVQDAESAIDALAVKNGFMPERTVVELRGHCSACYNQAK